MRLIFCAGALWLIYVYAGYPLILAWMAWRRRVEPASSGEHFPSVSVLIAARNEERDIKWKIAETLAWDYPREKLQVLVASDASDDLTDELVAGFADPRVILVRMERRGGKVRALNRLAEMAHSELLFFTDANAHIGADALQLLVRHFADPRVGCVSGNSRSISQGEAVAGTAGLYRRYECMLWRLESEIGSLLVCDGAIFCMRAALFQHLSPELANDLETPMRVAAKGSYIVVEPKALVFEHDTSSPLEEFKRQRRMCAQGFAALLRLRGVFGGRRGWQFVSHKLLRWLSLVPMVAVLCSSAVLAPGSIFFAVVLALQAICYGLAAIALAMAASGRHITGLPAVPFYIILGLAAALVGVIDASLGRRFDIWEVSALSRGRSVAGLSAQRSD